MDWRGSFRGFLEGGDADAEAILAEYRRTADESEWVAPRSLRTHRRRGLIGTRPQMVLFVVRE
jgi:hypothetical protein